MDRAPSDLLGDLLQRARKAGADAADAMLVESGALGVTRRLGKLEKVERAESHDLGLRVFVGRRQAIVSTGELDGAALDRLVAQAVTIAKAVPEDRYAGLAEPEQIATTCPSWISTTASSPMRMPSRSLRAPRRRRRSPIPRSPIPKAPRPTGRAVARRSRRPTASSARSRARAMA